jgi:hypothetical protein
MFKPGDKVRRIGGYDAGDVMVKGEVYTVASLAQDDDIVVEGSPWAWMSAYFELVEAA